MCKSNTSAPGEATPNHVTTEQRPISTVDVVIFTVWQERLCVLLTRRAQPPFARRWALPGGFVHVGQDADLLACAQRILRGKTGVQSPYLEQLGSWGSATRDPRGWSATHVYFALIPPPDQPLAPDAQWVEAGAALTGAGPLAFDHADILATALARLRAKVEYTSLPAYLLPQPFTLPQLQRMYEVVLGRAVDKSGFRTRMLAADFLQEAGQEAAAAAGRPAMRYRLRENARPAYFPRTFAPRAR
ncbi:MAG: NUDIX domain-containing protein [Comamonadaceae bacterium]|nr:NUDIX domain-containing protein [Comamonadaceae bacterium]